MRIAGLYNSRGKLKIGMNHSDAAEIGQQYCTRVLLQWNPATDWQAFLRHDVARMETLMHAFDRNQVVITSCLQPSGPVN